MRAAGLQKHLSPLSMHSFILNRFSFNHFIPPLLLGRGWVGEVRAIIFQHKLFSILVLENSPPGPQGLRFLTHSLTFTLTHLKQPSIVLSFLPHLKIFFQLLPPFYHTRSFVFN